jgi:hypothetical protein
MESTAADDPMTEVRVLLTASGLQPGQEEAARMRAAYPAFRAAINALYDITAARYADPALRFRAADTTRTDWAR